MNNNIKLITERINKIEEIEQYIEFLKNSLEEINKNINNVNDSFNYGQEKEIYEQDLNDYSIELKKLKENFDIEEAKKYVKLSNDYNNWMFNYQRIQTLVNKNGISLLSSELKDRYNHLYKLIKDNKEEYERLSAKYGIQPTNSVIEEKVETDEQQVTASTNQQPSVKEISSTKTDYNLNTYQGRFDYLNFLITEYEKLNGDKNDKMYRDSKEFVELLPKWNENIKKINSIVISSKNAEKVVNPWDYEEMKSMPSIKGISGNKRIDKNLIVDYITIYVNLSEMLGRFNTLNGNFQNGQFIKSLESRINELKIIKKEDEYENSSKKSMQSEQSKTNSEIDNKIKELKSKIRELQDSCKGLRPAQIQMFVDHTTGQKYNIPRDKVSLFRQHFAELKRLEKLKSSQNVKPKVKEPIVEAQPVEEPINEESFTETPKINPGIESSKEPKVEPAPSISIDSIDEYIDQQLKSNNAVDLIQILLNVGNKFGYEKAYNYFNTKFLFFNSQLMELDKQIKQNSDDYQKLVSNMVYYNIVEYSSKKKGIEDNFRNLNDQYKIISKKKKMYGLVTEHFKKLLPYANDLEEIKKQFKKFEHISVVEEPIVEEPIVEEPTVEEPIVEEPIVEEPTVEEPIVKDQSVEEPIVEEQSVEQPDKDEEVVWSNSETKEKETEKTENKTEPKKGIIKKAIQKIFNIFKKRKPKNRESLRKQIKDNIYSIVGSITYISTITPNLNNPLHRSIISDLNGYMIENAELNYPEKIKYDKTAKIDRASDNVGKGIQYDPNFSWEKYFEQQESGKQR